MSIKSELEKLADPEKAKLLSGFFKTGKGQYGEGDIFLGVMVPNTRKVVRQHEDATFEELEELLNSKIHEHRLAALLVLVENFPTNKDVIYEFYMKNTKKINNWDLVDCSAPYIVGGYLLDRDRSVLYKLAKSDNIWERRIAIIATLNFIKNKKFDDTVKIAEILLEDKHDLIHKAVGWMLREMGKRGGLAEEEMFLQKNSKKMPRTMLRYAIERFDKEKRGEYMKRSNQ